MDQVIISSVISLSALGGTAAVILFFVAQKFKVIEDPRIDEVEDMLPAANCGACGYPGCRQFAEALVKTGDVDNLFCPVGGNENMKQIAEHLGLEAKEQEAKVAVVKCNGSFRNAPRKWDYEGPQSCEYAHSLFAGDSGCPYGCLGLDDCVEVCDFDAIYMDENTGLPVVIEENCTACNACVEACPRNIIELRPKGKKNRRTYIACINEEKTGPAKQNCSVPCIGCGLCVKECPVDAISMENNLAYIDPSVCVNCRKCEPVCPTNAIIEANFPPRKKKPAKPKDKKDTEKKESKPKADTGAEGEKKTEAKQAKESPKQAGEPRQDKPADSKEAKGKMAEKAPKEEKKKQPESRESEQQAGEKDNNKGSDNLKQDNTDK